MINDYSEVMSTIHKDINKLQDLLNRKQYQEAEKKTAEIQRNLQEVKLWIFDKYRE